MAQAETTLITPRRNFLIRALGFTAAGATMAIPIITAASAKERVELHVKELEKAWREYYGANVRIINNINPAGLVSHDAGYEPYRTLSHFLICAGGETLT